MWGDRIRVWATYIVATVPVLLAQNAAQGWGDSVIAGFFPHIQTWWGWLFEGGVLLLASRGLVSLITPTLRLVWFFPFPTFLPLRDVADLAYQLSKNNQPEDVSFALMADRAAAHDGGHGESILNHMAGYMQAEFKIYARNPPMREFIYLGNLEGTTYVFQQAASQARRITAPVVYSDAAVRKSDLRKIKNYFSTP